LNKLKEIDKIFSGRQSREGVKISYISETNPGLPQDWDGVSDRHVRKTWRGCLPEIISLNSVAAKASRLISWWKFWWTRWYLFRQVDA
jgi:hypothetical protein